jgi:hypothetical protein
LIMTRTPDAPPGYVRFAVGRSMVVCANHVANAAREALRAGTLFRYAETHSQARALAGRGVAYAVPLPGAVEQVVVRHNRHGGAFARFTGDLFRLPTRAPLELEMSERLRGAGVQTPAVLGYALYPAPAGFCRSDIMTREVSDSFDLSVAIMSDDAALRSRAILATAGLVSMLSEARARHHDLNVKNVLLRESHGDPLDAFVLDVDRVEFVASPDDAREANLARLLRSAYKWRSDHGARVTEAELADMAAAIRGARPARLSTRS